MKRAFLGFLFAAAATAQVTTVPNTDFPTFRANLNSSLQNAASITGNYSNPVWITAIAWSKLTGVPSFYGTVQVGGSAAVQRPTLNLIQGTNVTLSCADNSGAVRTDCTINASAGAGGYVTVQVGGVSVTQRSILNFSSEFTVADNSGSGRTDVSISSVNVSKLAGGPIGVALGGTNGATAPAARAALNIDGTTTHGDSNYTILATDRVVATSAVFTASRTWTLPAASSVNAGQFLHVVDSAGAWTMVNALTIARAGSDTITIGGATGQTSIGVTARGSSITLISDGVSTWTASLPYDGPCQLASALGFKLDGSDESTLLTSVLTNMSTNGGCLAIDKGKTLSYGASGPITPTFSANGAGVRITGGVAVDGNFATQPAVPLTFAGSGILKCTYTGGGGFGDYRDACLQFLSNGRIEVDHTTILMPASGCVPAMLITNPKPRIHDNTFLGGQAGSAACHDAIVLGGTQGNVYGSGNTNAFGGYGATIRDNAFLGMAHAGLFQGSANGIIVEANAVIGGNTTTPVDSVWKILGQGDVAAANVFDNNMIELSVGVSPTYASVWMLGTGAQYNRFKSGNQIWDPIGGSTVFSTNGGNPVGTHNVIEKFFSQAPLGAAILNSDNVLDLRRIPFFFDGGGSVISGTQVRCSLQDISGKLYQFSAYGDTTGSATIKVTYVGIGSYTDPSSATNNITPSGGVSLSSVSKSQTTSFGSWTTTTITPNVMVCVEISGITGFKWLGGVLQWREGSL